MDEKRMGEIALAIVKARVRSEPIRLGPTAKREIFNLAKTVNVNLEPDRQVSNAELKEFLAAIVMEAALETFSQ